MIGCSFKFDNSEIGCKLRKFMISQIYFNSCRFTRCPRYFIYIQRSNTDSDFFFTNKVIEGSKNQFINAIDINREPVIENNTFRCIEITNGSLIQMIHRFNKIELVNNTFFNITTSFNSYGGGISSYYQNINYNETTIIYTKCKFFWISNTNKQISFNQGGAIQYGYSTKISDVFLIFDRCEFKQKECSFGSGGALGINTDRNLIIDKCLFENNRASYNGGAFLIMILVILVY